MIKVIKLNKVESKDQNETENANKTLIDQIIKCGYLVLSPIPKKKNHHCQFNSRHVMNWGYFTVLSLFGIGKHFSFYWEWIFKHMLILCSRSIPTLGWCLLILSTPTQWLCQHWDGAFFFKLNSNVKVWSLKLFRYIIQNKDTIWSTLLWAVMILMVK